MHRDGKQIGGQGLGEGAEVFWDDGNVLELDRCSLHKIVNVLKATFIQLIL